MISFHFLPQTFTLKRQHLLTNFRSGSFTLCQKLLQFMILIVLVLHTTLQQLFNFLTTDRTGVIQIRQLLNFLLTTMDFMLCEFPTCWFVRMAFFLFEVVFANLLDFELSLCELNARRFNQCGIFGRFGGWVVEWWDEDF